MAVPCSVVEREKYTEREAATAVKQIAAGMDHCHALGVAHRDLKPENLMYSSPDDGAVVKIVDFGLGKVVGDTNVMFTACGTPGYVAPEILRGESYTTKVDIWSLGVILYILLCGFPPFYSENNAEVSRRLLIPRSLHEPDSRECAVFISLSSLLVALCACLATYQRSFSTRSSAPALPSHLPGGTR